MEPDSLLDDLLERWEEEMENGVEPDLQQLCSAHPHLLEPLRSRIAAIKQMDGCLRLHEKQPANRNGRKIVREIPKLEFSTQLADLTFLDRGGLGVVYAGYDEQLRREVAVKFLHEYIAARPADRARFIQEAEITGRLDHPGVVPVYAIGQAEHDVPFYVMRFIRGDTYDDAILSYHRQKQSTSASQQRVAMQKLLLQLVTVCQTIAYAHTRGIIHRDIKPQNIMMGKYGETLVLDWGLAIPFERTGQFRVRDEQTLVPVLGKGQESRLGEGTPAYMSPEQAAGRENLGPSTDIYSLGVVLYRLMTGKFAFDGPSPVEIRSAIIRGEFLSPRRLDPSLPRELEAICLQAMALKPEDRYQTALEMADDLSNYLADAPVSACRYTLLEKLTRWVRRHQTTFTAVFGTTIVLALASMLAATRFYSLQGNLKRSLAAAESSQWDSLGMTCQMTARSIQYNLESRLMVLEEFVAEPEVREWIASDDPELRQRLKQKLARHRLSVESRLPSVSWFVLDRQGELICRAASDDEPPAKEIERWKRPYFHGGESTLTDNSPRPEPLRKVALSPVFIGQYREQELCSLSVPVADENDVIGVLVMTMQMGQFDPLIDQDSKASGSWQRFAVLVETRGELEGALLHHPGLSGLSSDQVEQTRVGESMCAAIRQIDCNQSEPGVILNYVDPIGGKYGGQWNSVALPIRLRGRGEVDIPCGWYLLVQDRPLRYKPAS